MIRRILVPLDGSALAESVLPHAVAFARLAGAGLTLAQVVEPFEGLVELAGVWEFGDGSAERRAAAERAAADYLTGVARRLDADGVPAQLRVLVGPPAETIIRTAGEFDLITLATHGRGGPGRWVYGSVTDRVLLRAPAPILLIRAGHGAPAAGWPRRILVPLDGSAPAERALPMAAMLARRAGGELLLLQSIGWAQAAIADAPAFFAGGLGADRLVERAEEGARAYLVEVGRRLAAEGPAVETAIRLEPAAEAILGGAAELAADLIVLSTHGRGGPGRWRYGSVADRVLRGADLPVLLVRADAADSPATAARGEEAASPAATA
jgi:nucleotide-binding universal stress UspA family protein